MRNANGENQIVVDFPETNGTLALKGAIRDSGSEFSYVSPDGYKWVAGHASFTPKDNGEYTITYRDGFSFPNPTKCIPVVSCWGWYNSSYACQIGITSVGTNNFSFKIAGKTINNISCVFWALHKKYARYAESVKATVASGAFSLKEEKND